MSAVTLRAFDSNEPISADEMATSRIWSDQGWINCEDFDGAVYPTEEPRVHHAYLESRGLDAEAVWVVLTDSRIVAVPSIDLF